MLIGLVDISDSNNSERCDREVKDTAKKSYFEIGLLFSELYSNIAAFEYLDVAAALNKSIEEEGNDTESIIVLAKQLKTLSAYKPDTSSITIPMSRDELRKSVVIFIKAHGELFSVKMLENLQLKVEKL